MSVVEKEPMVLNSEFKHILDEMEKTSNNLFVSGKAGTGKSTLLNLFMHTTKKNAVVLAPTGIAALNVGGQTIHSFFGFAPRLMQPHEIKKRRQAKLYQNIDLIIIDEISMVRADVFDNIDYFMRLHCDAHLPFGGKQIVLFGDLFQLPPVVSSPEEQHYFSNYYKSAYFFDAKVFANTSFQLSTIELRKIYRQEERHFIRLLEAIRTNRVDFEDLEDLNTRYVPNYEPEEGYLTLTSRNMIADALNEKKLKSLTTPPYYFQAKITGEFDMRLFPTEQMLQLKLGAQVMFVRNDPERRFVNGMIGKVVSIDDDKIEVEIKEKNGQKTAIEVQSATWEILRYKLSETTTNGIETETIGSFKQYPLRLAWAITIHKSQGKTFENVVIDLGTGAFEYGQTYVALSRCKTLGGIVLKQKLRPQDIMTDERIVEFYEQNM